MYGETTRATGIRQTINQVIIDFTPVTTGLINKVESFLRIHTGRATGRRAVSDAIEEFIADSRDVKTRRAWFAESLRLGRPGQVALIAEHARPPSGIRRLEFASTRKPRASITVRGYSHVRAWKRRARS